MNQSMIQIYHSKSEEVNCMWKDIPGYEGIYEASTTGGIRSKEGKVTYSTLHGKRKWESRILKQKVGKDRCCRVNLYKNKKENTLLVHRLVAFTFIPTVPGKEYVNHIDGNRLNNAVENLEWCDHKENNNHAFDTGLIQTGKKAMQISADMMFISKPIKENRNEIKMFIVWA